MKGKRLGKTLLTTLLVLVLVLSGGTTAFAAPPASSDIQVQFNGKNILFTDAVPKIIGGRTMVPFRQILETMGAEVTFDQATGTVRAKTDQLQFSFPVNGTKITIIQNGSATTKQMDVAPYLDPRTNRTYVPARFMAESLGYAVGWDQAQRTAVILDTSTLFATADTDFSILASMLSTDLDRTKAYETTGTFDSKISVASQGSPSSPAAGPENMAFTMKGEMAGVQQNSNADMTMKMNFAFDTAGLTAEEAAEMKAILDQLKDITMSVRMNGDTGVTYMNSPLFQTVDPSYGADTWFRMDVFQMYDDLGFDIRPLLDTSKNKIELSKLLGTLFSSSNAMTVDTYRDAQTAYVFLKYLVGDAAFQKQESGDLTTYTLDLNQAAVVSAMAKTALVQGLPTDDLDLAALTDLLSGSGFKTKILIQQKAGKLHRYEISGFAATEEMAVAMDLSGDTLAAKGTFSVEVPQMMKMEMTVDSKVAETGKMPVLTPPAGANIVNYSDLMK